MNTAPTNDLADIRVSGTLDNVANESASQSRVARAGLLVPLLRAAQARGQIARRDGPDLDAVLLERAHPIAHHHVHAGLARSVRRDRDALLGPPLGRRVVDGHRLVFALGHRGRAAGHEEEPRVG